MRFGFFLLLGVSALTLGACNTTGSSKMANTKAPEVASEGAAMSAQELEEMATVMGQDGAAVVATQAQDEMVVSADGSTDGAANVADTGNSGVVPDGCPIVEVLPDTRSITYFEDTNGNIVGEMSARASIKEIRGGCEYEENAVMVDIDMIMEGHITKRGRYEGREDLEAFMTFPYFIAVMDPQGNMVDKKIMATAMRFKAGEPNLAHAEKITQVIPLSNIAAGSRYTIATGFQLNRQQLEYNRGSISAKKK